jgi:2-polyprenyl-3-methyl-5-hydroxy-6-metoxy-1,4-benzoquinol methylase
MLLTISTTYQPATDLGYLLHKNPAHLQTFSLNFGQAHVFYPEATAERCTAALLLDINTVQLVRDREKALSLDQYVNDRPYVASSFFSVALAETFGTALSGRCKQRPELVETPIPLQAQIAALPCRGGEEWLRRLFEPLGYTVTIVEHLLDEQFAEWGTSPYYTVTLAATCRLQELLTHLYVLIPVLDDAKHYWIGDDEVEKLLRYGKGWLETHPERNVISYRYLRHKRNLTRDALSRLVAEEATEEDIVESEQLVEAEQEKDDVSPQTESEQSVNEQSESEQPVSEKAESEQPEKVRKPSIHEQRLQAALEVIRQCGAHRVLDLGCGEGRLLKLLLQEKQIEHILGLDVSYQALTLAQRRLHWERMPERQRARIELVHGALTYRDKRLEGYDAAAVIEVIEHLDQPRLTAFERVLFEFTRPGTVIITTPNSEYNVKFETLQAGRFRHEDHRFEWSREQFQRWAQRVAERYGYGVRFAPIGPEDEEVGALSQMSIFSRLSRVAESVESAR